MQHHHNASIIMRLLPQDLKQMMLMAQKRGLLPVQK